MHCINWYIYLKYCIALISSVRKLWQTTVQLHLNSTHACRYMCVLARLIAREKLQKLACAHTVARDFGMRTRDNKRDTQEMHVTSLPLVCYTTCVV